MSDKVREALEAAQKVMLSHKREWHGAYWSADGDGGMALAKVEAALAASGEPSEEMDERDEPRGLVEDSEYEEAQCDTPPAAGPLSEGQVRILHAHDPRTCPRCVLENAVQPMPHVTIEARYEDSVWKVDVDRANRNSGFACKDTLSDALAQAVEIALENFVFRRDRAGEKLDGPVGQPADRTGGA